MLVSCAAKTNRAVGCAITGISRSPGSAPAARAPYTWWEPAKPTLSSRRVTKFGISASRMYLNRFAPRLMKTSPTIAALDGSIWMPCMSCIYRTTSGSYLPFDKASICALERTAAANASRRVGTCALLPGAAKDVAVRLATSASGRSSRREPMRDRGNPASAPCDVAAGVACGAAEAGFPVRKGEAKVDCWATSAASLCEMCWTKKRCIVCVPRAMSRRKTLNREK